MPETYIKKRLVLKKQIKILLSKILITTIIFLIGMIAVKSKPDAKTLFRQTLYETSLKFTELKKIYNNYFGKILSIDKVMYEEVPVFKEKITYQKKNTYKDGVELTVDKGYMIPCLESGIVVYIGEKEGYGPTIIIEQENGIDVFYSNITVDGIKLYDYIEQGEYVGSTLSDKFYLIFQKDGIVLDYQNYI